jgi:hypothetical protein
MYKKNLFKKSLVVGIIVLFIGTSVLPTISGNIVKTSNKSTIQGPTKLLLSDNYVNGYWKFDEGSGNTAHDSSVHNYDGTIYGASWTTGYSSYALDFDGVSDYVDLDAYARYYLGFNKTDDLIFSFYIKSTSSGIIYSVSKGDDYNPGVQILLNSNGTLEFRVWRLSCGIQLTTVGTYNDGSWHHFEIFYNGFTADPTVEIYVDGSLDTNITKWVCSFYSDQFSKAKIGRHSYNSTGYFDGIIDEFKITKYPGGNEQNPPNITGPTHGDPGVIYDYTFVTNDPEGDDIWIQINWGDGQISDWLGHYASGQAVVKSHKWNERGKYSITAKSKDFWHFSRSSDSYVVRIGNFPPDPPTINGPKSGEPGIQYTYTFKAIDYEGNNVSYYVEWGDGTHNDWFGPYPTGVETTASHAWNSKGDYNIRAKAKDNLSLESDWSDLYPVRIGDEPPAKLTITGPSSGKTGIEYNFTFVTTDPEGDNVYYEIKWGDGKEEVTDYYKSGKTVTRSHTWEKKGTYIIQARAGDIFDKKSQWESMTIVIIQKNKGAYRSIINQKFANILFFRILEQCYLRFIN